LSDLFNDDFAKLYPQLSGKFSIGLYDAATYILADFEESLREHAIGSFSKRNVQVVTDSRIKEVTKHSITTEAEGRMPCGMVLWTAGNKQCPLVDTLDVSKSDKLPRIMTDDYLHVLKPDKTSMQDVFALGDAADIKKHFLPTTAEVAIQKAKYLATCLNKDSFNQTFEYYQKPLVAYIGGHDGVVRGNPDWSGGRAWAAWRSKNLLWTKSWRRKFMIMAYWMLGYLGGTEMARA
jgi:NADH:ubiquinone reductase (non-electrogenic)